MTKQTPPEELPLIADRAGSTLPLGGRAVVHPEVLTWLNEAKRLFNEAEQRLESGEVLPALSSLAAVPLLHRMLVGRCSEMLDPAEIDEVPDPPSGFYL